MDLKERIVNDLKEALRAKDQETLSVLRLVISEVKKKEIDDRKDVDDSEVLELLAREIKKVNDSIEEFKKGDRKDLVEAEEKSKKVLEKYLPDQLNEGDVRKIIEDAISSVKAESIQDLGNVMKEVMPKVKGRFDGKKVNEMVRDSLIK